jgi:hypothetical protein
MTPPRHGQIDRRKSDLDILEHVIVGFHPAYKIPPSGANDSHRKPRELRTPHRPDEQSHHRRRSSR